jgi:DNA-binding MarR family transcriptional regulator
MSSTPEHLGLLIKRLQDRHHRLLDAALGPLGVSLVQWNALREIERNPGSSQHKLAQLTFNSDQAFGTLTTRLIERGLVERQRGAGRAMALQLTPFGRSLYLQGAEIHSSVAGASFAPLDAAERHVLSDLLTRLLPED